MHRFPRAIIALLVLSTLFGCQLRMPRWSARPVPDPQAERLIAVRDYEGAMQRYEYLARTSSDPDFHWLRAADAALRAGDGASAQQMADAVRPRELDDKDRNRYLLLASRLDLNAGRAREAMAKLNSLNREPLDPAEQANYHTLRASAYNQMGNMLESARERIALGKLLNQTEAIRKNNDAIFDALARLPDAVLADRQQPPPDVLGGWMALTRILKDNKGTALTEAVEEWRIQFPGHPAEGTFLEDHVREAGGKVKVTPLTRPQPPAPAARSAEIAPPSGPFVGVLLPLSGPYAAASQAIRSGLMAAHAADSSSVKAPLYFVDSQSGDAYQSYLKLAEKGATAILGPLVKENVAAFAKSNHLPVPVLALNQVPGAHHSQLFQFGLTPEHEVEQAAGSAWFDGRQNALVLAPNSQFGQRMTQHFTGYWRMLGGKVVDVKTYTQHAQDFASAVASLLGAGAAYGTPEANFVFLVADARDARAILPQISQSQGAQIPVYSTSHAYSGKASRESPDPALNGLIFCDIPWMLNPNEGGVLSARALESQIRQTQVDYVKLIALGLDAYRLLPELTRFRSDPQFRFSGATGSLSLRSGNRIQRQLECAQFNAGALQVRGIAPVLEPGTAPPGQQ